MYLILATKRTISSSEFTQPVAMRAANAVTVDMTVFAGEISDVILQASNDLENWSDETVLLAGGFSLEAGAYYLPNDSGNYTGPSTGVGAKFVRLKIIASPTALVSCGVYTSEQ